MIRRTPHDKIRRPLTGWALRDNIAARDALCVAAARALLGELVTTDDRLARAAPDIVATIDDPA